MSPSAQDKTRIDGSSGARPLANALSMGFAKTPDGVPSIIDEDLGTKARINVLNKSIIDIANDMGIFADLPAALDHHDTELRERVTALRKIVLPLIGSLSRHIDLQMSSPLPITIGKGPTTISGHDIVVELPTTAYFFVDPNIGNDPSYYFVDATHGDDSNSGTSPDQAWRTIDKINNTTFTPGDVIAFKRGEEWHETLSPPSSGTSGNPITFTAYGSGALPLINGADSISGWTLDSGNVWQASVSWEVRNVYLDGAKMIQGLPQNVSDYGSVASKAAIGVNDWFWEDATNTLFAYATSDPDTLYTSSGVEGSRGSYGIDINSKDFVTIEYIEVKYGSQNIIVRGSSDNTILDKLIISFANYNGISIEDASTNTTVQNSHSHDNGKLFVSGDGNAGNNGHGVQIITTGAGTVVENNQLYDNAEDGIQVGPSANTAYTLKNNNIYGNHEDGIDLKEGDVTNSLVIWNDIHDNHVVGVIAHINAIGVWILENTISGNGSVAIWIQHYVTSVKIHANLIYDNGVIGTTDYTGDVREGIRIQPGSSLTLIEIFQNTIYHSGDDQPIRLMAYSDNVQIKNNIIVSTDTDAAIITNTVLTGLVEQYNLVHNSNGTAVISINGTTYDRFDVNDGTYTAAEDLGQNTIDADPDFVDTRSDDYRLNSTSPAEQAG